METAPKRPTRCLALRLSLNFAWFKNHEFSVLFSFLFLPTSSLYCLPSHSLFIPQPCRLVLDHPKTTLLAHALVSFPAQHRKTAGVILVDTVVLLTATIPRASTRSMSAASLIPLQPPLCMKRLGRKPTKGSAQRIPWVLYVLLPLFLICYNLHLSFYFYSQVHLILERRERPAPALAVVHQCRFHLACPLLLEMSKLVVSSFFRVVWRYGPIYLFNE